MIMFYIFTLNTGTFKNISKLLFNSNTNHFVSIMKAYILLVCEQMWFDLRKFALFFSYNIYVVGCEFIGKNT